MTAPVLSEIIDTYIPISQSQPIDINLYYEQLKTDLIPHIRHLQDTRAINWFCFLIHGYAELHGREPESNNLFINIKLSPSENVEIKDLINKLPEHFKNPIQVELSEIAGINKEYIKNENAWFLHGQCSEFVFKILENHEAIHLNNIPQLLHFITNPLGLSGKFVCAIEEAGLFFKF